MTFITLKLIKKLIIVTYFVLTTYANFILSVSSTSYSVNNQANLTINIRTSTPISVLDIVLSDAFVVKSPVCRINSTSSTCNKVIPSTGNLIYVRFSFNFLTNMNYTLTFNITNPSYSESFSIQGLNGAVFFGNSGTLTIDPKKINCSMSSTSTIVGQSSNTTFLIKLETMQAGTTGQISLTVNSQQVFPNVINSSPSCSVDSFSTGCNLGQIFGSQVLSLNSVDIGVRANPIGMQLLVNSIRNSPFNSSFQNITISILDQYARRIEQCIVQQPGSTTLQQSSGFTLQGWGSTVGQVSNAQFILTPFFTPLTDIMIILVTSSNIILTPKSPAVFITTQVGSQNYIKISNLTYSSQILSFNTTFQNPSATFPLFIDSYILYNDTLFRQRKSLPNTTLTLRSTTAQIQSKMVNPLTLTQTVLNTTITTPIKITTGFKLNVVISYGRFYCSNLSFSSNLPNLTLSSCTESRLSFSFPNQISSLFTLWIVTNYFSHFSVATNTIQATISSLDNYSIMNGSSTVPANVSSPLFIIVSMNSTYTAITSYTFNQSNNTAIGTGIIRYVTITPPSYVKFSDNSVIRSLSNLSVIQTYNVDISTNKFNFVVLGKIQVVIESIKNPSHYLGGRQWKIECKDGNGILSSISSSIHTPQYSPARSSLTLSLSNRTIQQLNNITLTFQPLLQYDLANSPQLTVTFVGSTINNVLNSQCSSCNLLTSTKFSMKYYSVVMRPIIEIYNNKDPKNNTISFIISISDFIFQLGQVQYQLDPIQFQLISSFSGIYGNLGQLTIRIVSILSTPVSLNYSGTSKLFSSGQQCNQCNSTYLLIRGIVGYFQTQDIVIEGFSNNTLYAKGIARISYTCSKIQGCQICQTVNTTLQCSRCFNNLMTNYFLLFQNSCYSSCPAQTFENGAQCSPCPSLCYLCTATNCLQCVTNHYLYESSCVTDCPPLYIKNATHCLPRPVICPKNCIDCPSDNTCNKCDAGFLLLQNLCYTSCPTNYVAKQQEGICKLFVPPQQTKYFPFAFFIISMLSLVILKIIQCFQKRSLIMGNLISIISLVQIGTVIMMFSYTFSSINNEPDRWTSNNILLMQALLFVIVLTKVALNIIFLVYFQRKIAKQQNFQNWVSKSEQNKKTYIVMMVLSTIFSFQLMRIIYCRFLGLQIFFGRFNTSLIFKPINFFSLAYIVPGGCLLVMAIFNIIMQNGYKTSIFYSSIEIILLQISIFTSCIVEACRNNKQYFDYQIYKVQNESENSNTVSKVKILEHEESGGSFNQILLHSDGSKTKGPIGHDIEDVGGDTAGKIIRNRCWREKKPKPIQEKANQQINPSQQLELKQQSNVEKEDQKIDNDGILKISSSILQQKYNESQALKKRNNERSIFRKKIIQQWEELKKKLPKLSARKIAIKNQSAVMSKSPTLKKVKTKLTKTGSLEKIDKIQIKPPLPPYKNKKLLKNYFYRFNKDQSPTEQEKDLLDISEVKTIQENQPIVDYDGVNSNQVFLNTQIQKNDGQISEIPKQDQESSFQKSLLELKKDIKVNRYDDFDQNVIQQDQEEKDEASKNKELGKVSDFDVSKKKVRKRNVNRHTEAVYLQRLVSSSQNQRTKPLRRQKLQNF